MMNTMECVACQLRKLDGEAAEEQNAKARERQGGAAWVALGMMGLTLALTLCVEPNFGNLLSIPAGAALGWLLVLRKQQMAQKR